MKLMAMLLAMALVLPAYAFRSTHFESFTDPDYTGYKPMKLVVIVVSGDLETVRQVEAKLSEAFQAHGVEAVSGLQLFPPTRPIESYDVFGILASHGIESALVIEPGERKSDVFYGGSTSTTTFNGNQATTTTTPQAYQSSSAHFTASLLALGANRDSTRKAWYAQIETDASGWIFVSKKGNVKSTVKSIVQGLDADGHLPSEKPKEPAAKRQPTERPKIY